MGPDADLSDLARRILTLVSSLGLGQEGPRSDLPSSAGFQSSDDAIQKEVMEWVHTKGLGWGVVSEDAVLEKGDGKILLFLDPLDGSYNALNQIPFYSTSLGLMDVRSGELVRAMVMDLSAGHVYRAERGGGSYCDRFRLHTRTRGVYNGSFSFYLGPETTSDVMGLVRTVERARYLGCDSLEMCAIARGAMDGAIYIGRLPRKTDIAASLLVLREAGGEVYYMRMDSECGPLELDKPWRGFKGIIALGCPDNLPKLLEGYHGADGLPRQGEYRP